MLVAELIIRQVVIVKTPRQSQRRVHAKSSSSRFLDAHHGVVSAVEVTRVVHQQNLASSIFTRDANFARKSPSKIHPELRCAAEPRLRANFVDYRGSDEGSVVHYIGEDKKSHQGRHCLLRYKRYENCLYLWAASHRSRDDNSQRRIRGRGILSRIHRSLRSG